MAKTKLVYKDFRPIRQGDAGWTPEKEKSRWHYSPSSEVSISYRRFVTAAQGGKSYEQQVKEKEKKGYVKRQYKPRKTPTKKKPTSTKKKPSPKKPIAKKVQKSTNFVAEQVKAMRHKKIENRLEYLQDAFARKQADYTGISRSWDELSDQEKTLFWDIYHDFAYHGQPSQQEFSNYYQNFFDMEYSETDDIAYGETP